MLKLVASGRDAHQVWEELSSVSSGALPTQTPAWMSCMTDGAAYEDVTRLYERLDGRHVVLPLVRFRLLPPGMVIERSLPNPWDYAGPLASGGVRHDDIVALVADLRKRRVLRTTVRAAVSPGELRAWDSAVGPQTPRARFGIHVLDLAGGFERVWHERFTSKVRSASRKAERRGVRVEWDSSGRLLPVFEDLYVRSIERWARERGEPVRVRRWLAARQQSTVAFVAAIAQLGEACRVWIAYHEDRPAAGIIVVRHGDRAMFWRGAMDKERVRGTGATELLHRRAVEHACESGVRFYDMGTSTPTVDRFKKTFGTTEVDGVEYRFETLPLSGVERAGRSVAARVFRRQADR